jgi:hypothetical protein
MRLAVRHSDRNRGALFVHAGNPRTSGRPLACFHGHQSIEFGADIGHAP